MGFLEDAGETLLEAVQRDEDIEMDIHFTGTPTEEQKQVIEKSIHKSIVIAEMLWSVGDWSKPSWLTPFYRVMPLRNDLRRAMQHVSTQFRSKGDDGGRGDVCFEAKKRLLAVAPRIKGGSKHE
jgi:hypothetical protein